MDQTGIAFAFFKDKKRGIKDQSAPLSRLLGHLKAITALHCEYSTLSTQAKGKPPLKKEIRDAQTDSRNCLFEL